MPIWDSSAPRKKLPPPTTIATCTPARTASPISWAIPRTTSGASPTFPPPKVSPESLSSTRRGLGVSTAASWAAATPTAASTTSAVWSCTTGPPPSAGTGGAVLCGAELSIERGPRPEGSRAAVATPSGSHAEPCECRHHAADLGEHLCDGLLLVLGDGLVDQHVLLEEPT